MRQIDEKYGNLVNMIQGLGQSISLCYQVKGMKKPTEMVLLPRAG